MVVKVSKSASITGSLVKLRELRELVKACEEMADESYVDIKVNPGDYGEGSYYTISVSQR